MINVSKTFLPDRAEYNNYLKKIWDSNWLTNNGSLLIDLENRLSNKLGSKNLLCVNNGTMALQLAIKALDLKNEVITTPFSYVATVSSLVWQNCEPVFCDIDSETLNIDHRKIETLITSKTTAILATHVYGNPCEVEGIDSIAKKYNLKVIYDAAHCFDVKYKNESILNFGDISAISFHSTKIFHSIEGGALITNSHDHAYRIKQLRNFGHKGYEEFDGIGINGKQSEFHAAMGHCVLDNFSEIINGRKRAFLYYDDKLAWEFIKKPTYNKNANNNYSYYPIILSGESETLELKAILESNKIFPRRYFYPSLTSLHYLDNQQACPISDIISKSVLCLPLFHDITQEELDKVIFIINNFFKG
ncbi:DegT/DnrJ/EryC1/StrS family aminotransferase [Marivirga salinae]|uniref:DegT/DnrJ/EryC1/StrS family aminotransferase n=1 Tax=Marivirga salinarum TaxID=3059078 RepID=A0AA51NBN8_9BACT|nr:DegT/DnrJ/EryC1/StrS family aminotransferase [Marivirga sp. BDSF4-3]WMN12188.1 DegT/DnrJ/EryC1/StrS family aminotransferase [Marivirga sp. BDSF4-3]